MSSSSLLLTSGLAQIQTGWLFAFIGSKIPPPSQIPVIFSRRIQLLEMTVFKRKEKARTSHQILYFNLRGVRLQHWAQMSPSNSPYHTDFLLNRLLPWPQTHMNMVWMPTTNHLSPTPPLHSSLQPLTFKLFSRPLLLPVFVILSMISIWLGHVLQVVHCMIRSVVFIVWPLWCFSFLTLHFPVSPFLGLIAFCFFHFLLSCVFPPSVSVPWCHCVLDLPRCGHWHICEYHMIKHHPLP